MDKVTKNSPEDTVKLLDQAEKERAAKRFEHSMNIFLDGNNDILKNREFVQGLSETLYHQFIRNKKEQVGDVLKRLFVLVADDKNREVAHSVILSLGCKGIKGSNIQLLQLLCREYSNLSEKRKIKEFINDELAHLILHSFELFIRINLWDNIRQCGSLLWKVRNVTYGGEGKNLAPYKDILRDILSKDVLEKILQYRMYGDEEKKKFSLKFMSYVGLEAILYILHRLVFSTQKEERLLLIEVIRSFGSEIEEPIRKFMQEDLPWHAIRNLVILVANIGNHDNYSLIEGYLMHPDERVQHQVIVAIMELKGNSMPKRLAQAFPIVNDAVKRQMIVELVKYGDEEISQGLLQVIRDRIDSSLEKDGDDIIARICVALRAYPYESVSRSLKSLSEQLDGNKRNSKSRLMLKRELSQTIHIIEPKIRHRKRKEVDDFAMYSEGSFEDDELGSSDIEDFIVKINDLILQGEDERATSLMYSKAISYTRSHEFDIAERLRDELLEMNPDALQDVLELSDRIEEERLRPRRNSDEKNWNELEYYLDKKEYSSFKGGLIREVYGEGETLVREGDIDPTLYFIQKGSARLTYRSGKKEVFLKKVMPGDVFGKSQFFFSSIWTVTITAINTVEVLTMKRQGFETLKKIYPALEEKLVIYTQKKEDINKLVSMSGNDRRDFPRYKMNKIAKCFLFDIYCGSKGGKYFNCEIMDISQGGLSFCIKISSRSAAEKLLGRHILSELSAQEGKVIKTFGTVVAVQLKEDEGDQYSVHIQFQMNLEQKKLTDVLNVAL